MELIRMLTFLEFSSTIPNVDETKLLESCFDADFWDFNGFETVAQGEQLDERARSTSDGMQPWKTAPTKPDASWSLKDVREWGLKYIVPAADKDVGEFTRGIKRAAQVGKNSKVLIDRKQPKSIFSKLKRGKGIDKIHDIIRGAILVSDKEALDAVKKQMRKIFKIYEFEEKKKGGDKDFGYFGSVHYKVELANGNIAEIQVMTKELWATKHAAHKIYELERDSIKKDKNRRNSKEFKSNQKASRDLFARGAGNKKVGIKHGPNMTVSKDDPVGPYDKW